jgi:hypothetical protein
LEELQSALLAGNSPELAVLSKPNSAGSLVGATAKILDNQYVSGVSKIVLTGKLTDVDNGTAKALIGSVTVDFSALLQDAATKLSQGETVTFVGTQPQEGGQVLATGLIKHRE